MSKVSDLPSADYSWYPDNWFGPHHELRPAGDDSEVLFRLKPGWVVQICIGPVAGEAVLLEAREPFVVMAISAGDGLGAGPRISYRARREPE